MNAVSIGEIAHGLMRNVLLASLLELLLEQALAMLQALGTASCITIAVHEVQ